jgi:CHAT domain-containing protein/tetratricopeptide (TPR) repeat protein
MTGSATAVRSDSMTKRGGSTLGLAEVLRSDSSSSVVAIELTDGSKPDQRIYAGDLVSLQLEERYSLTPTVLSELVARRISYTNDDGDNFYGYWYILLRDNDSLLTPILAAMAADLHAVAKRVDSTLASDDELRQPLKEGHYQGRSVLTILATATSEDASRYLDFVTSYPGSYVGRQLQFGASFANWLVSGATPGKAAVRDELLAAKNDAERQRLIAAQPDALSDGVWVSEWITQTTRLAEARRFDDARALNHISMLVVDGYDIKSQRGLVMFEAAQIDFHAKNREAAIAGYRAAIPALQAAEDEQGVRYALNNIADELNQLGRYVDAMAVWDTVVALERARTRVDSSAKQRASLAISLNGFGRAQEKIDRYDGALATYAEAVALYTGVNTAEAQSHRADALNSIAGIYGKQGDREKAIRTYEEARAIYHKLEDGEGEADQLDEIGLQTSKLSKYREAIALWDTSYALHMESGEIGDAGYAKSAIGQAKWSLGDYAGAIEAHNEAVALREKADDKKGVAYSLGQLASLYRESGDPNRALDAYRRVAALYAELEDLDNQAATLNSMGDVYYNTKDYPRAIGRYHEAEIIQARLGTPSPLALTYYDLGDAFYQRASNDSLKAAWDSAGAYYTKGATIQRQIGDDWNLISSLNSLGYVAEVGAHDRLRAEGFYREALDLAQKLDAKVLLANCYVTLGRSFYLRGLLDSAEVYHRRALAIYREQGDRRLEAVQLSWVGDVQLQRGDVAAALVTYREGLAVAEDAKRRPEVADLLTSIAWVQTLTGEYAEAVATEERGLAISQEVQDSSLIANSLFSLGNTHEETGDYQRATGYFQQAESMFVALRRPLKQAGVITSGGVIAFWQGDYPKALAQFNRALDIVKANGSEGDFYPLLLGNIGEVYYEQGSYDHADHWLTAALAAARAVQTARTTATALTLLGKTALDRGRYADAAKWLQAADTLRRRMGVRDAIAEVLTQQGKLAYVQGALAGARAPLEEAVRTAREIGAVKFLWEPLFLLGEVRRDQGDTTAALQFLEEAVSVVEQLRNKVVGGEGAQKLFASGRIQGRLYEALVGLLIRRGEGGKALTVLERSMNEEIRGKFRGLGIQFADSTKARLLAEEERRKSKLDGVTEQLARERAAPDSARNPEKIRALEQTRSVAEEDYLGFVNQIMREEPDLKNHMSVSLRDLRNVRLQLRPDVALLAYLLGEKELYIFVVTSDTLVAKVVALPRDTLDRDVELMVQLARNPTATFASVRRSGTAGQAPPASLPVGDVRQQAARLYQWLIAPIKKELGTRKRLAIVPSGSLYFLPFQILTETADSGARTLGDERSVFYVTELKVAAPRTGPRPALRLAAFGNADNTLPSAEREVLDLKRLYPTTTVFLRTAATEAKAKSLAPTFNVVHFATHGNLDYQNFDNTFLTLAPSVSPKEDGKLTLREVWKLVGFGHHRLVVLSACNTAVTDEQVAGWPNSPATAFLDVGVPAVVASLWPVDDAATAILITAFYKNMGTMDTAEALRQAQLTLKKDPKYAHPYYWGAWVLVGDWR